MRRFAIAPLILSFGYLSLGAKGCGTEYDPGDGSSKDWATGPVPTSSGIVAPMTCEWLESDNCWKAFAARASACQPAVSAAGQFDNDRQVCSYGSGATWELGGSISAPGNDTILFPATDWRIVESGEDSCMTGKILGLGRTLIDIDGEVSVFENPTLTTYHVTCPDGTTYGNDQPGTCEDFGSRYLAHTVPGVLLACDGGTDDCALSLWGTDHGEELVTRCDL